MAEESLSRYLASYLKQNENLFLVYSGQDECDVISEHKLQKVIEEFVNNQK